MNCSCCGLEKEPGVMASLRRHEDIQVCRDCIDCLRRRAGLLDVTPTLPVRDMAEAIAFYESAGFDVRAYDGGFAFVQYAGASVFDLDLHQQIDPARNGAGCYIIVADPDRWSDALSASGLPVSAVEDKPWGMREFTLTDPSGNSLRIGRSSG